MGYDNEETIYRMLKIDRTVKNPTQLADIVTEDPKSYSKQSISDMLDMIHEGNKGSGGLIKVIEAVGLSGFIRFLDCYYIVAIIQRKRVGSIGNNAIYGIKQLEIYPIKPREDHEGKIFLSMWNKINKKINQTASDVQESKYLEIFQFVDMTKDFYFSYTYDITHSLQYNYVTGASKQFPNPPFNVS